ncbi:Coenzyme F420 hydrogenase/dehydrogenase, beta subunit C-terminal domain [Crocosphaera sp. UHCC 0190]|uniref:Coenzyme F420 hydrogenase/dehydrogenase, beta subunit C-terminal domain n=1 Tax=Crocosphaera sp. UHCC 0190 TaxID=3110246 RepID=UPI002B217F18|nr:Coenzyme F420 hydrogenase/dehydrogenase, beta subunit C-terminal domain [Crocosphaera sp. UHCC 0190]MEA5509372.1 Coenzyme F420 hydrogenase/dehydrogenase, beta subunit C-terminal domain [Crocosphaera sp. UHCC 0190]
MLLDNGNSDLEQLFDKVVDGGYCIGCGACASINNPQIQIKMNKYEQLQATLIDSEATDQSSPDISVQTICPFSDKSLNEDQLGQELFSQDCKYDEKLGYYLETYAGYVNEGDYRHYGSSGGMGSWIISQLLSKNLVDGVIHVKENAASSEDKRLFKYDLSTTLEDIQKGAKSRYYPVEMSEVIKIIREKPARYAIVGIPCFIKSIRLLVRQDPVIAERIKFCIGLVCGHLKSTAFAKMFAWQCGIEPDNLLSIDFRKKLLDAEANKYGVEVTGIKNGEVVTIARPVQDFSVGGFLGDWGMGFFKYKACDYCDDVVGETADISIGDAWLPQYVKDSQGTNIVIVRHPILYNLIEAGKESGELKLDCLSPEQVLQSQAAGFRHRHDGLAYRLHLADKQGTWRPNKRIKPQENHLDEKEQKRFYLRTIMAEESHLAFQEAYQKDDISIFEKRMMPIVEEYKSLVAPPKSQKAQVTFKEPLWKRVLKRIKGQLTKLFKS